MATPRVDRHLAAILAADVVGYARLMERDEVGTLARLKAHRKEFVEPLISEHKGRIVKLMGDGALVEFPSVVEAVQCAVEVQRGMADRNARVPEEERIEFRIGIDIGDIILEEDDIYGEGVNLAARLEGLAEPSGVCLSRPVVDQLRHKLDLAIEDLGELRLKNIGEPVRVYRIVQDRGPRKHAAATWLPRRRRWSLAAASVLVLLALGGALGWRSGWLGEVEAPLQQQSSLPLPDVPSIAVLPFTDFGDDAAEAYFAEGIAEDIITDLSKVSGLFVIARNSSFAYRNGTPDVSVVARALGVRYVMDGSVRRAGEQVRINVRLVDASSSGNLWAERFDGKLHDIFGLQDQITRKIVTVLAVRLTTTEQQQLARQETSSPEAYDAFLQGWQLYLRQTHESLPQAVVLFERALELDPGYGRAYAALAATYWQSWKRYWHDDLGLHRAHDALFKVEELLAQPMRDPTTLALQLKAEMLAQRGRHDEAIADGERAVALDPNDADSYVALAAALNLGGRAQEAMGHVERAMRLNPLYPPHYLYQLGLARFGLGQLDQAAEVLERAATLNPEDRWPLRLLLAAYGLMGRKEEAAELLERARQSWQGMDALSVSGVAFWYPFRNAGDTERLLEGLRRAGVPE
ncbi:MAG: adenylate/guanylate cyclase domain-containing protein [Geminicoccaceae bacterium]